MCTFDCNRGRSGKYFVWSPFIDAVLVLIPEYVGYQTPNLLPLLPSSIKSSPKTRKNREKETTLKKTHKNLIWLQKAVLLKKMRIKIESSLVTPWLLYLLSDGVSRHQLRFDGDEEAEEGSFAQAAAGVVSTFTAQTALLTVSQQHWRSGHLKRPVNLNTHRQDHHILSALLK